MKLTIIIDNYNYGAFVGDAIDSALSQTWSDVEVVVVDDGSTDDSRDVINSYGERIRPVFKENGGQHSALNTGFGVATGDVVIFLDADDRVDAGTGERVMHAFAHNPQLGRVQWPLRIVGRDLIPKGSLSPNPASMASGELGHDILRYRTHAWPPQSGNAYSAAVLRTVMPIPDYFYTGCDRYLADITALSGPVLSLRDPGGDYRVHGANATLSSGLDIDKIRDQIAWTLESHKHVHQICTARGIAYSPDPLEPLDVAFLCQRLASLRLEPELHPIESDSRLPLALRAAWAASAHPHHSFRHKVKRVGWIAGVGLGPKPLARKFVERFYFKHRTP